VFAPRIAVSNRGRSKPLDRVLSDFGAEHSFAKAAQQCKEHYGFEIPPSAARAATLEQAERARLKLEAQYKEPFRLLPARGSEHVVAEADGTMICTVEPGKRKGKRPRFWQEMRLAAAQAHGCSQSFYAATFDKVEELGRRWAHCAKSAGWGLESQIHVVADGAEWIRLQSREVFSDQEHFLCDFYHVSHYLADASKSCRAQSPERWRKTQQKRLKNGAATKVIQELAQHIEPPGTPEEEAPVFCAHRYMNNRGDAFDYPRALKHQLPIGSGLIESGHRHVLQARLKAAGTSWLPDNAERMAQLRVLRANHQWESLWN
jgi:hypothetical protein